MMWILHTARISNDRTVSFLPSSKLTITNSYSIYNHQLMFVWNMDTCNYFTWSLQNLTSHSLRPSKYNLTRDGWENGSLCLSRNSHLTAVQKHIQIKYGHIKKCVWPNMVSLIRPARPVTTLCFAGQKVLSLWCFHHCHHYD